MKFSVIITLCLNFALCQGLVDLSRQSFLKNQTMLIDGDGDILEQFFVEFNRVYLSVNEPRTLFVIGSSTDNVRRVQPLSGIYPHVICTDVEKCAYPDSLSAGSLMIIFLEDMTKKTFDKYSKIQSNANHDCTFLFVCVQKVIQNDEITSFLRYRWKHHLGYAEFVHVDSNVVRHYGSTLTSNCKFDMISRFSWRPGSVLSSMDSWALRLRSLDGCPVNVSTFNTLPSMAVEVNPNGLSTIVGGPEGRLILTIAEKLQFTVSLNNLTAIAPGHRRQARLDILHQVANRHAEFGIGQFRATNELMKSIQFSRAYGETCVTWAVSLNSYDSENIVWSEFPWQVWALIGPIFIISCVINICILSKNGNRRSIGSVAAVLDVVSMHLGNPVIYVTGSIGGRLLLMFCLLYSTVITTGYKSSLASILTTTHSSPVATNLEEILKANLSAGGSLYNLEILKDMASDNEEMLEWLRGYEIVDDMYEAPTRLKNIRQKEVYFSRRSTLEYIKHKIASDNELIRFSILDDCLLTYHTVMVFRRGSKLLRSVDDIVQHLVESGIIGHWERILYPVDDKSLDRENEAKWFPIEVRLQFKYLFILYAYGQSLCILVFFIELIIANIYSRNRQRIVCLMRKFSFNRN